MASYVRFDSSRLESLLSAFKLENSFELDSAEMQGRKKHEIAVYDQSLETVHCSAVYRMEREDNRMNMRRAGPPCTP